MDVWTFRRLTDDDLPLLHEWLNEPGVVRFWEGEDVSWPAVVAQYGSPELRAALPTEHPDFDFDAEEAEFDWGQMEGYIAELGGTPAGWIQCYATDPYDDHPEVIAWRELGFDPLGAGIDYLLGDAGARGQGQGSSMIERFVHEVVFGLHPDWNQVGASPMRANGASCGALAKAGLDFLGSFEDPEHGPCDLYGVTRPS